MKYKDIELNKMKFNGIKWNAMEKIEIEENNKKIVFNKIE